MSLEKQITAQLKLIQQRLDIIFNAPSQPGDPVAVQLAHIPTHLQLVDSVPTQIDLGWLTKDVMLKTGDDLPLGLMAETSALPTPTVFEQLIQSPKPLPLGDRLEMPSGIPGVIGQFVAQLPVNVPLSLPVHVEVEWYAADESGNRLDGNWAQPSGNVAGLNAVFFFAPRIVPYSELFSPVTKRKIVAKVKLSVEIPKLGDNPQPSPITHNFTLEADVPVPTLPVPVVLAMLTHNHFDLTQHGNVPGGIALFVPRSQFFYDVGSILNALGTLTTALNRLSVKFPTLPGIGSTAFVITTINQLVRLLRVASSNETTPKAYFVVRPTYDEREFHDVKLPNGFDLGKEFGSMILIGPPGTWASFFNHHDWETKDGAFDIGFKPMPDDERQEPNPEEFPAETIAVAVYNLHGGEPERHPYEALKVTKPPKEDETFGDNLSSFRFNR